MISVNNISQRRFRSMFEPTWSLRRWHSWHLVYIMFIYFCVWPPLYLTQKGDTRHFLTSSVGRQVWVAHGSDLNNFQKCIKIMFHQEHLFPNHILNPFRKICWNLLGKGNQSKLIFLTSWDASDIKFNTYPPDTPARVTHQVSSQHRGRWWEDCGQPRELIRG